MLQAKDLLKREGFAVDDHWLKTREETNAFKREHHVESTPQVFIDGQRIGGYDALQKHLGKPVPDPNETTCRAPRFGCSTPSWSCCRSWAGSRRSATARPPPFSALSRSWRWSRRTRRWPKPWAASTARLPGRSWPSSPCTHVSGALYHALVKRDGVVQRMLPAGGASTP